MKKVIVLLVIAFGIIVGWRYCQQQTEIRTDSAEKPIKSIGISLNLSGDAQGSGQNFICAIKMAVDELNANPDNKYQYKTVLEDDHLDNVKVVNIANKFIHIDKVDAVVSAFGGDIMATYTEKAKIPHVTIVADKRIARDNQYTLVNWVLPEDYSKLAVDYFKDNQIKSVSFLALNHPGADAVINQIIQDLQDNGVKVLNNDKFSPGEKHFNMILQKHKQNNPDRYFVTAFVPEIDIIARDAKHLGIGDKLVSLEAPEWSSHKDLFENTVYFAPSLGGNDYAKRYRDYCKHEPMHGNSYVYDSIMLLGQGFENSADKNKLIEGLKGQKFDFSKPIFVDENRLVHSIPLVKKIQNGKVVLLKN